MARGAVLALAALAALLLLAGRGGESEVDGLARLLDIQPGDTVADIGAGDGWLSVEVAKRVGATPAQVAQAWVLSHPEITISISGADTAEQMEDNLGALEIQLPTDELATLNDASDRLRIALDGAGFEEDQ